jgi:hypothetical protein
MRPTKKRNVRKQRQLAFSIYHYSNKFIWLCMSWMAIDVQALLDDRDAYTRLPSDPMD